MPVIEVTASENLSRFTEFVLPLSEHMKVSGIFCVPPEIDATNVNRPLIVLLHGGRCRPQYFDLDANHSAATIARALDIPVVAIDRPCYGQTTSVLPLPPQSTFHQETGKMLHDEILPALWRTFGVPNSCKGLVAVAHSLASPGLIVAAALFSETHGGSNTGYNLAGMIISGWGTRQHAASVQKRLNCSAEQVHQLRRLMMLSDPVLKAADLTLGKDLRSQTVDAPDEEARELGDGTWCYYWSNYARKIRVPIMYGIGEHDWLWHGTEEHVDDFKSCFPNCPRFEGSVAPGAPHAIEWSYYSKAWYAKCFGFAIDAVTRVWELGNR